MIIYLFKFTSFILISFSNKIGWCCQGPGDGNKIGNVDWDIIDNVDWMDTPIVPNCLSSQLKTCSLIGFKGRNCDFQFAKYILKNAKVLQIMTINAFPVYMHVKHQLMIMLYLCPRGSTTCKISFDWLRLGHVPFQQVTTFSVLNYIDVNQCLEVVH